MKPNEIYAKAIEHWGEELQVGMLNEEMAELTIAVNKHRRNPTSKTFENIIEEIADVRLMLEQTQFLFHIADEQINLYRNIKIKKLEEMIRKWEK